MASGVEIPTEENIRTAATCTTSYAAANDSSTFRLQPHHARWFLELTIVKGSSTSFQWLIQGLKADGSTWVTETATSYASGTTTVKPNEYTVACADLASTDQIVVAYPHNGYGQIRVRFKETGGGTGTLAARVRKVAGQQVSQ